MKAVGQLAGVGLGVVVGVLGTVFYLGQPRPAGAASNDRFQDHIMATGAVSVNPRIQTDGVWLLDAKTNRLLGTVIDRTQGKIVGWSEVDLRAEFGANPDAHFMMTTGYVTQGQSALYLAETTTGKLGVYTMGPGTGGTGVVTRRHDMNPYRNAPPGGAAPVQALPGAVGIQPNGMP